MWTRKRGLMAGGEHLTLKARLSAGLQLSAQSHKTPCRHLPYCLSP